MRKKIMKGILYAIFPLIFNVLFFVLGGANHPASVWLSYAWIHVAYLILIAIPLFTRKTLSAGIFRFTSGQIAILYFGIELLIGLIFIFIGSDGIKAPLIIQLIPFCLFLFAFMWNMLHDEHTADNEQRRRLEINFIKTASIKVKSIMDQVPSGELKNRVEKLYDLIHSSPSKSNPSVRELENSVMMLLNELSINLEESDTDEVNKIINKIHFTMEERNRIVSLSY